MLVAVTACFLSCATSNPNLARVLTSISVTPEFADAQSYPEGQVVFTATGTYSLAPLTGPVTSAAPYSGQFEVANPLNTTIATIIATGNGTATVQCAAGVSGTVSVAASAYANNGTTTLVSGNAQLTCP